ncbi:hypothetical protein R1sor_019046 [Riccia sorocarpa]|uniref:FCP1 homology domain-containing protein n=1 Tax=Riccia sorocarpa TaxID=122646 RepID=A0ABD3IEQ9_9MARC
MSELDYSTANVADWRSTVDMQAQLSSVQSAVRERREEEERMKVQVFKMETYMRKVKEDPLGLLVRVLELRAERARLEEWLREQTLAKQDLEEALRMQRLPLLPRWKTIVIDLNGLLMKIAHSWSQEHCTAYQTAREQHKDGFLRCKSVQVLYDFGICTKDVIIIDDTVQKNLPNYPFQAVHPRPFDPFKTAKKDENYLSMVLQPFLDKFRGHKGDGISYVQTNWQAAQAQDLIASLAGYWAPMDERDEDFLWSNCTAADRQRFLAELNRYRLKLSAQKAMQFAIADKDQPSQTQDGAGPSNSSQTVATELGRPIFPAPLSTANLVSNAEILLAGCRDDDMELSRLHED